MAKKKEFKPIKFQVEVTEIVKGEEKSVKKTLEIWRPSVIVPALGKFTAAQLVDKDNEKGQLALAELVKVNSGVLREFVSTQKKGGN